MMAGWIRQKRPRQRRMCSAALLVAAKESTALMPPLRSCLARSRRRARVRAVALAALAAALGLAAATAARAELVILADGGHLKVKGYELDGDGERVRLTLPAGGRMTLALTRIERVVDDEVAPDPEPDSISPAPAGSPQAVLALRFEPSQAVPEGPWGALVYEASRRHGLNPGVVAAVIRAESSGNPFAVSRVGARGLMQLMPATAERFGIHHQELFDPAQNLEAGSRYLSWLADQFPNDLARVLAAYNAGENAVARYGGVPPYRETRGYVRRIFASLGLALVPGWTGESPGSRVAAASARSAGR
jgi:soluble lytic murein transglycosylase-like protein